MEKLNEIIVVEGKYDKNTVSQVVDAFVVATDGFDIFNDKEKQHYLRLLAEKRGLIIFTDSDGAGFVIRNFIRSFVPAEYLKHAYIPDIYGKEKRKRQASREGKLGVEGMPPEVILDCLKKSGAVFNSNRDKTDKERITKADFYNLGLTGKAESNEKRKKLALKMNLPERITANAMLQALNIMMTREEFYQMEYEEQERPNDRV